MEKLQLTPDDVWLLSRAIEKEMFQCIAKLQERAVQVVTDLKRGDTTVSRANVFSDWAKESCTQISTNVPDFKLVWVAKDSQPQDSSRALMSQVPEGSLKHQFFGMLEQYFEVSDQIYADAMESLKVFKAQLKLSEGIENQMVQINQKS